MKYKAKKAFTTSVDLTTLINQLESPIDVQNAIYKAVFNQPSDILTPAMYNIQQVAVEDNADYKEKIVIDITTSMGQSLYINSTLTDQLNVLFNNTSRTILNGLNDFSAEGTTLSVEIPLDAEIYRLCKVITTLIYLKY